MKRGIDHIVYCVPDLEKGIDDIANLFGVRPVIGGRHITQGTKNALLNLGNKCYLEILAIDKENVDYLDQRWMGIDLIRNPKITRWSLKSDDLESDSKILEKYSPGLGTIGSGSRKTSSGNLLSWKMILPTSTPEVELIPFMTDWSESEGHPTDSLQEVCSLHSIVMYHPSPEMIQAVLSNLGLDVEVKKAEETSLEIWVDSPNGLKNLC